MELQHLPWTEDADVCGEAAGFAFGDRVLDLVVTHCGDGTFEWDVVDGCELIASGIAVTAAEARREAEDAGRRALFSVAA